MQDFEILVLRGANPCGVSTTHDILAAAALLAARQGVAAPRWRFYSPSGGRVALQGGIDIETRKLPGRKGRKDALLLVPGIWVSGPLELRARLREDDCRRAVRSIAAHVANGGQVAASCSSVFLLEAAGLLVGRRATTAWWLAPELARIAPNTTIESQRILCVDGPVMTAGAAFAQSDVLLYLLRRRFGVKLADGVSRVLLLQERTEQAEFVAPAMLSGGDALVDWLTDRIEKALPDVPAISELAEEAGVSERTLSRRVRKVSGMSPRKMVQSIRLHRARSLLQRTHMGVEQVAAEVGYRDATALRRLVRRWSGATPRQIRSASMVE
ncbi:MAG: GlxA family transcriptional regulator [Parvularculaceae bacterium]